MHNCHLHGNHIQMNQRVSSIELTSVPTSICYVDIYILLQFGLDCVSVYSVDTTVCVYSYHTENEISAFNGVIHTNNEILELLMAFTNGGMVGISLLLDRTGEPPLAFFEHSTSATVQDVYDLFSFDTKVSVITITPDSRYAVVACMDGFCTVYEITDPKSRVGNKESLSKVYSASTAPHPMSCCYLSENMVVANDLPLVSFLIGSRDGTVQHVTTTTFPGSVSFTADTSRFCKCTSPIVNVFVLFSPAVKDSPILNFVSKKFILVVELNGTLSLFKSTGELANINRVVRNLNPLLRNEIVSYASVIRDNLLIVQYGNGVYISDLHSVKTGCSEYLPSLECNRVINMVWVSSMSTNRNNFTVCTHNGILLTVKLPEIYLPRDIIAIVGTSFNWPIQEHVETSDSSLTSKEIRKLLNEKHIWSLNVKKEASLNHAVGLIDLEIRKFIALNSIFRRRECYDPLAFFSKIGKIEASLESVHSDCIGSINVIVTISSTDIQYIEALDNQILSFSVSKDGYIGDLLPVQSISQRVHFAIDESDEMDYTCQVILPITITEICPLIVNVEMYISTASIGTSDLLQVHSDFVKMLGCWLNLGSIVLQASDIFSAFSYYECRNLITCDEAAIRTMFPLSMECNFRVKLPFSLNTEDVSQLTEALQSFQGQKGGKSFREKVCKTWRNISSSNRIMPFDIDMKVQEEQDLSGFHLKSCLFSFHTSKTLGVLVACSLEILSKAKHALQISTDTPIKELQPAHLLATSGLYLPKELQEVQLQ